MQKNIGICTLHKFKIVFSKLKRRFLKSKISWRATNDETKVYMNDMSVIVDENVVIMPVLYLEKILNYRITSQTLNEVRNTSLPIAAE